MGRGRVVDHLALLRRNFIIFWIVDYRGKSAMELMKYAAPVFGGFFVALCALSISAASAQTAPPPAPPAPQSPPTTAQYSDLLNQGFEIKSTIYVSEAGSMQAAGAVQQQGTVLVTMQKGPVVATCWAIFSAWNTQALTNNLSCNLLH